MTGPESEGLKKGTSLLSVELIPFSLFLRKFSRTFGMAESFMSGLPGCRYSNQIVMLPRLFPFHGFQRKPQLLFSRKLLAWLQEDQPIK